MGHEAGIQSILMETSDVAQARDQAGSKTQLGACRSRWVRRPSQSVWLTSFGPTSVGAQESLRIKWRFSFQDVVDITVTNGGAGTKTLFYVAKSIFNGIETLTVTY